MHEHPPQSPDLNPIEAVWLLLNERLKQLYSHQLHEMDYWRLRAATEEAWDLITIDEIRNRISEMPWRCKQLIRTGGARVKGSVW